MAASPLQRKRLSTVARRQDVERTVTMLLLKQLAARLPHHWQTELKRIHFRRQIKTGSFSTDEPEYEILHSLINPGDWVIDVGANVGHYTKRFSELVGAHGERVSIFV